MEIRAFAEQILLGPTLDDKLASPRCFTDVHPGSPSLVTVPNRAAHMRMLRGPGHGRADFPPESSLQDPRQRAKLFHFFANHELLAMEIMALVLLRFPDAAPGFRAGLARTIQDEQRHLQLYLAAMREQGLSFGDLPLNDFFWSCLAKVKSPLEFATGMSLTFEQANLDYAVHYAHLLRSLGDNAGAAVLETVHQDEIRHVQHGLKWFRTWKGEGSDWDSYLANLPEGLSAARGKGIGFAEEARIAAGFDDDYISNMRIFQRSKGRRPDVHIFNIGPEKYYASPGAFSQNAFNQQFRKDLGSLPMFLAGKDDFVLVDQLPSEAFLRQMQELGVAIPGFFLNSDVDALGAWKPSSVQPFGWDPEVLRLADQWQVGPAMACRAAMTKVYSKAWQAEAIPEARLFHTMAAVEQALHEHFAVMAARLVLKAPYGSSGQALKILEAPTLSANQAGWLATVLKTQHAVVMEPWLRKVADLSALFDVQTTGEVRMRGITRFLTDRSGKYLGHYLGKAFADAPVEVHRALFEKKSGSPAAIDELRAAAQEAGARLFAAGYTGPAGIDALLYADGGGVKLRRIVEINARTTMGHIALALEKCVHPGTQALWLTAGPRQKKKWGVTDWSAWERHQMEKFPLVTDHNGTRPLLSSGLLPVVATRNDSAFTSFLWVGGTAFPFSLT